ncbi:Transposon, En/Spm-like protein [Senna tora]|uniref:Transposon, En/Spm-like protein n=1 Tax=Senna tora TaxID=362788 RepID=A0A835CK02_9FABA|nr:Transposon, En/Spm-like protein [Senna tora]
MFHGEPLDTPNLNPKIEVAEVSEPPKYDAKNSYATTEKPLYESCKKQPPLSAVSKLLKIKSEFNLSENCYNRVLQFVKELLPNEANFPNESSKTPEETLKHFEKTKRVDTSSQPFLMTTRKKKKTENCVAVEVRQTATRETSENNLKDNISDTSNTGVNTTNNLGS